MRRTEAPTLITIDFDYFIPECVTRQAELDFGGRESLFFLHTMWVSRMQGAFFAEQDLRDIYAPIEVVKARIRETLDLLKSRYAAPQHVVLSESHLEAYNVLKAIGDKRTQVVSFDSHHDLGYKPDLSAWVTCDNWLRHALNDKLVKHAHIASHEDIWLSEQRIRNRNGVTFGHNTAEHTGPVTVHLCRSGVWVPPWYDDLFLDVGRELGDWGADPDPTVYGSNFANPLEPRQFNIEEMREAARILLQATRHPEMFHEQRPAEEDDARTATRSGAVPGSAERAAPCDP